MSQFEAQLDTVNATDKEVIILGDFNCDFLPARSTNSDCEQLKSVLKFMNFNQLIKDPTCVTQTSATLLDLIVTNGVNISFSGVTSASLGDHGMVLFVCKN
jgi:hypothetical protein